MNNRLPRVTEILAANFGSNPFWTEKGRQKGTALHMAIKFYLENRLNMDTIGPQISGKFLAFQKFIDENALVPILTEVKLESKRYRFTGTPDVFFQNNHLGDWKSSIEPYADFQLALYSILYEENYDRLIKRAYAIELRDNGTYNMRWVDDLKRRQRQALKLLDVYNIKKEYGYV